MRIMSLLPLCWAMICYFPSFAEQLGKKPKFQLTENFDKALELAKAHDLPLVLIFTARDFCSFSQKLYDKILMTEEFAEEVNKKFIFVKIDFKDAQVIQDSKLLEHHVAVKKRYNIQDFPQILLLDPKGLEIAKLGYSEEMPLEYGKRLVSVWQKYQTLKKEIAVPNRLTFEFLKEIFIEAKEMGAPGLVMDIVDVGLKVDKDYFFLLEAYRRKDKEARKKLKDKILAASQENSDQLLIKMDLADLSDAGEEQKKIILHLLKEKTQTMKDKGVDMSKLVVHLDELLDAAGFKENLR
jgi:thioredoxin-related protein